MTGKRLVKLSSVMRSQPWQVREQLDENHVRGLVALLEAGGEFKDPPVVWVESDGVTRLIDGFHRMAAYERVGREDVEVEFFSGTREEAQWESRIANTRHGLMLTNADKRRAVEWALIHRPQMSDRAIAVQFNVSHVTVGTVRKELESSGRIQRADVRTSSAGRAMNTAQIGASQQREHWSVRREQEFWIKARRYGLTDEIRVGVLDALQPGSTALSQFEGSFEEALTRLHKFALEHHYRLYPVGGYAAHIATGKVAKVEIATAEYLKVFDERNNDHAAWMIDGIRPSDENEHAAYLNRGKSSRNSSTDLFAVASVPTSPHEHVSTVDSPPFVRAGRVVGFSQSLGDCLALVESDPKHWGQKVSVRINHLSNGKLALTEVYIGQVFDPVDRFVRLPGGEIGIIQSVREDRLSVTRPNADGGNQTNTLLWTNCTLVLLAKSQRVKTRTGRIGELVEDQNGRLLKVRDLETGIISEHVWQTVIPMPTPEPVLAAEEPQAEPAPVDESKVEALSTLWELLNDIDDVLESLGGFGDVFRIHTDALRNQLEEMNAPAE